MRARAAHLSHGLPHPVVCPVARTVAGAALLTLALSAGLAAPALSQQARTGEPARPEAAQCFVASEPAGVIAACDRVLAGAGTFNADQIAIARQRRGAARAALGRIDEAIEDFRQMAASGFRPHEAHASIGSLEFRRQRLREAETAFREALRLNASYALAHVGLGHTLIGLSRPVEAVIHFDQALATAETDAGAHLGKGVALAATGDRAGAIRSLDRALAIDPGLLPALYQRAQIQNERGDTAAALADADRAVAAAVGEERIRALVYRGRLRNGARAHDGAIADCEAADAEAERLRLTDVTLRLAASMCAALAHQSKGALDAAHNSYEKALTWDASNADALSGRGYVALQRGRFDAAIRDFEAALRTEPRSQDALRFVALAHSDRGDRQKADAAFRHAIESDPNDPWPLMIRAIAAARDGGREAALADVDRAFALTGRQSSDVHLVRAAVHYSLDDLDSARADLGEALRLDAENGQAHRLLARLELRVGRLDEARQALDRAAKRLPVDATFLHQRGLLALAQRDFFTAVRELSASLAINSAFAEPFAARGEAYEALGDRASAIADYRAADAAIATDPDGRRAQARARQRLTALTAPSIPTAAGTVSATGDPGRDEASRPQPASVAGPVAADARPAPVATQVPPGPGHDAQPSMYCRLVEGVFVHSRRYTGVDFDIGCKPPG